MIHRDLKPSNVMVGSFGEVQVMDWGLAKVLPRGGVVDDASAGKVAKEETVIATARSGSDDADLSHAGSAMGTPSYMAPEQARGEIDRIDERADVFALGSILCEILTGRPAFLGRTSGEILRKATLSDTTDALARLGACGADAELITLAKDCLAREPEDRPRAAVAVTERVTAYLAGVQEKLRRAELEGVEERGRRRLTTVAAAALLALTTMSGLGATYYQRQKSARVATLAKVVGEASTLRDVARENPEDYARWEKALVAVKQAEGVAGGDPEAVKPLAALRDEVQAGANAAERDRALLDRLVDIRSAKADDPDGSETDAAYAEAFREAGLDFSASPPAEAGAKLKARPRQVALAVAAALDDWASMRRGLRHDRAGAERQAEAARVADPDPWRNDLRAALTLLDEDRRKEALKALAGTAKFDELGAVSLDLLGSMLAHVGDPTTAERVLRRAQRRYSGDVWINDDLARALEQLSRRDDAIRFYSAARAVSPGSAHQLAHALADKGESDEALEVFRELTRLRPNNDRHLGCLGKLLKERGRSKEADEVLEQAIAVSRATIRLKPDDAMAHGNLGLALKARGKLDEALAEFREAIRLQPGYAVAHYNLGSLLWFQGKLDEALAEYREAIRLQPDNAVARYNLGTALNAQGKLDEAVAEFREAIRLQPEFDLSHFSLGNALAAQGKLDEAVAEFREAIRLQPDHAAAHSNLGIVLRAQGRLDEPGAEFREAIRLLSDDTKAHNNLDNSLGGQRRRGKAGVESHESIRKKPNLAQVYCNLGEVLRAQGEFAESLVMYRRGHELGIKQPGWRDPSAQWVAQAERLAALAERLPALLKGEDHPKDAAECLTLAQMCNNAKRFAAAARFWAEALEADPKLGDNRQAQHRYNAACSAALTAAGHGKDKPPLDEDGKTKLRGQALGWLKAEVEAWTRLLESGKPQSRPAIVRTLNHWKADTDLTAVRDPEGLAKLPEPERQAWQALWNEVEALLARARDDRPR